MDNEEFNKIFNLEREGSIEEAHKLLLQLVEEKHPMALLELSMRSFSMEGYAHEVHLVETNLELSKELAEKAKIELEILSENGDGEAMRMLAYNYFGYHGHHFEKNVEKAEELLLASYGAGCVFAANELATLYASSDVEKASYWYKLAEIHKVRVVFNPECESYIEKNT